MRKTKRERENLRESEIGRGTERRRVREKGRERAR